MHLKQTKIRFGRTKTLSSILQPAWLNWKPTRTYIKSH